MARVNRTRLAVLGFLSWGPMSGYDVKKTVEGSISNFWAESYGQIYPILRQLAEEGLATRSETATAGGRERHVYAITDAGRGALAAWFEEPVPPTRQRNELLLKLFFAARAHPVQARGWIGAYRERLEVDLGRYASIRKRLEAVGDGPADVRYWLLTLRYGELDTQALLQWCDEALAELDDGAPDTPAPAPTR